MVDKKDLEAGRERLCIRLLDMARVNNDPTLSFETRYKAATLMSEIENLLIDYDDIIRKVADL